MKTQIFVFRMSVLIVFLASIIYFSSAEEVFAESATCSSYGLPPKSISTSKEEKNLVQFNAEQKAISACKADYYNKFGSYTSDCAKKCSDATKEVQNAGSEDTCIMQLKMTNLDLCSPADCVLKSGSGTPSISIGPLSISSELISTYHCTADAKATLECNCKALKIQNQTDPQNP